MYDKIEEINLPNDAPSALLKDEHIHIVRKDVKQCLRRIAWLDTQRNKCFEFITKRFDVKEDGTKRAQDDFASLAGRTPQTHGEHYKYMGSYLGLYELMKRHVPTYKIESPKLFRLILFNYLFSNGDAHFKNFSLLETPMGDYTLSPAYDLLNSRIHVADSYFALEDGLLPKNLAKGKIREQFYILAAQAQISESQMNGIFGLLTSSPPKVNELIDASFLNELTKQNYLQAYQTRLNKLIRV